MAVEFVEQRVAQIVNEQQLDFYKRHGFVYLPGVLSSRLVDDAQALMEPWADFMVEDWRERGLISHDYRDLDFGHRFLAAWRDGGQPHFRRRPMRFLIKPEMYAFLKEPTLLSIASQILGSGELFVHGSFNGRPQLPGDEYTTLTPWHQDCQDWNLDYGVVETDTERVTHVITIWMPLQDVDEDSGCLQVMSKEDTRDKVFEPFDYDYKNTGYQGIDPDEVKRYPARPIKMHQGDALVFNQRTPHAAVRNLSDHARWSVDVRYEVNTDRTAAIGRKYGFVAQSLRDRSLETSLEDWLLKRDL